MQYGRPPLQTVRAYRQRNENNRPSKAHATRQTRFDFPDESVSERRRRQLAQEAGNAIVEVLNRLCGFGHSMAKETDALMYAEHGSRFRREQLMQGLRHAIRQRRTACEQIDGTNWLFPPAVRNAELTIARCARQLAEGPALIRSERARLEKISLICTSSPDATIDVTRRILSRLNQMGYCPTLLVQGVTEAQWYRWKLGRSVLESATWLREHDSSVQYPPTRSQHPMFVLLDTSRLGLEALAEILEAIPIESALMLIGTPREAPRLGHGQPFRDLVSTGLFQCVHFRATARSTESERSADPVRRSALLWRLRRSAGLRSNLRWAPIATIEMDEYARANRGRSRR